MSFFEPHPLVGGANVMENKALSERCQHAGHDVFGCDKMGGFTLLGFANNLFASCGINAPDLEKILVCLMNSTQHCFCSHHGQMSKQETDR